CESNLRHWIILIFFSMKIKHFHRSWVYTHDSFESHEPCNPWFANTFALNSIFWEVVKSVLCKPVTGIAPG
ncbi:MAG: hypothetical protein LC437_06885, partial [Thiohalomonas sp.]|nr:hypothetical protein [Thiohalomonas sp.]